MKIALILAAVVAVAMGSEFTCPIIPKSKETPTSVHALRPGDVKVIAALGDSLTAGRGASAGILGPLFDYRGLSWSMGGDKNVESVVTLPNILRKYNPNLYGYSTGYGDKDSKGAKFNVAVTGDESKDMPGEAEELVERLKKDPKVNFDNDWKLITVFIGGNDLCHYCKDKDAYSPDNYKQHIQTALDYLHAHVPRAFVNVVGLQDLSSTVKDLSKGPVCKAVHMYKCDCMSNPSSDEAEKENQELIATYNEGIEDLVSSSRYDTRDDFTVVLQPFFTQTYLPRKSDGEPDLSYFAPDCFHFSGKGQQTTGEALWNNMVEPVGSKRLAWSPGEQLQCPTEASPYLFTSKNSSNKKREASPNLNSRRSLNRG